MEGACSVGIVASYKHLGDMQAADGRMNLAVARREISYRVALAPLKKTVFRRKGLSDHAKVQIHDSLALSTLLTNTGSWPPSEAAADA